MNYEHYYQERFKYHTQYLEQHFQDEVIHKRGPKNDLRNHFIRKLNFKRDTIINERVPSDMNASSYNVKYNSFKERLVSRFNIIDINFPEEGINGFVEYDIPKLKKEHIERYENGNEKNYESDTRFMYDASTEDILNMIAKYNAFKRYNVPSLENPNQRVPNIELEEDENKEQGSTAQIVSLLLMINDEYKFIKTQNKSEKVKFIQFLTGRNKRAIEDNIRLYERNDGEIHRTIEKNIKDFEKIKTIVNCLDNQTLNKAVDMKIDKQKELSAKSRDSR